MFQNLGFRKTAAEIVEAATQKVVKVKAKIEERQQRVNDLRKEYGIDDAALVQLLTAARKQSQSMQFTYSTSNAQVSGSNKMEERTIGAGVVNNLLTENDFIEAERDQVKTLERLIRNLKPIPQYATGNGAQLPDGGFGLRTDELDYLGF